MNALVAVDAQLFRTPDGKVWSKTIYGYEFWQRYLDVFETITVASRIEEVTQDYVLGFLRSDGPNVSFSSMPMVRGMQGYIKKFPAFIKASKNAVNNAACAIIRLPSVSATFVEYAFQKMHKPYALEVVVDPANAYEGNKPAKYLFTNILKKSCLRANGVSYVTRYALQKEYPSQARLRGKNSRQYFESYYSSIILKKEYFGKDKDYADINNRIQLVHTANNVNNYVKGHDVVIKVVKKLRDYGIDARITFIGDGDKRIEFENMADELGIKPYVQFTGLLASPEEVRNVLMKSDLFIFPTKAEGLPRAVIEAMAVGLPCLSTPVNGIPELLEKQYLFNPADVDGFTNKIKELLNNPSELNEMSHRNIEKAKEYEESVLRKRRIDFYSRLKTLSGSQDRKEQK